MTQSSGKVEAGAERLRLALRDFPLDMMICELESSELKELARAVIEAMREPTDAMWQAGTGVGEQAITTDVYNAMIDAALEEGHETSGASDL